VEVFFVEQALHFGSDVYNVAETRGLRRKLLGADLDHAINRAFASAVDRR
jgi:hypothetical protein